MELELGSSAAAWFRFLVAALAVWRLTHLLAREDGPWDLVARLRRRLGRSFWGRLMDCVKCLSVWVALPFAFFVGGSPLELLVVWLALSGAAILLEQQIPEPLLIESPLSIESEGEEELTPPEPIEGERRAGSED